MLTIAMERASQFDAKIKARNLRECLAGVVVAAFFAFVAWKSPNRLVRAGNLMVAASGMWIVFYMLRYGREAPLPTPDRSTADFKQALLRKYDHQIALLKNVKYWYLLPPFAGLALQSAGIVMADIAARKPVWPQLVAMAVYTVVFGAVWWVNEIYAVGKLRRQRARLLEEMASPEDGHE